ncbi:MAG: DnaA N-terminal domain-containing protein, partial [Bryocella sp.]
MSFVPVAAAVLNQWVRILGALEKKINRQSFETWLKPTRYSHVAERVLYIRVPNADFLPVNDRYADLIQEAIENLGLEIDRVEFQVPAPDPNLARQREDGGFGPRSAHPHDNSRSLLRPGSGPSNSGYGTEQSRFDWNSAAQLNPRYQFDSFVIGSGNQFAHAA